MPARKTSRKSIFYLIEVERFMTFNFGDRKKNSIQTIGIVHSAAVKDNTVDMIQLVKPKFCKYFFLKRNSLFYLT